MQTLSQPLDDPEFYQNPYEFYARAREEGPAFWWDEYGMAMFSQYDAVSMVLRDQRFGREAPAGFGPDIPEHLEPFFAVERHSMLELEGHRHARLRGLVLRAFTSRRIRSLAPEIAALTHQLIDDLPDGTFDLIPHFTQKLPVIIITRLLGVPETKSDDLLLWSYDMVAMYQSRRSDEIEARAVAATHEFVGFMRDYIKARRDDPCDDLISELIAAHDEDDDRLSEDEMISTCILLLNAGHEATVHAIGNAVKAILEHGARAALLDPERLDNVIEETLRFDPPLHVFTRYAYEEMTFMGVELQRGEQIGLMLASANRDEEFWDDAEVFDPDRTIRNNLSFGAGAHFCVGAPLARLELMISLPILFERLPNLALAGAPRFGDTFHFHGLSKLMVTRG